MSGAALLRDIEAEVEAEESDGKRHHNVPYTSVTPLVIGGKATLRGSSAEYLLHWFGGEFSRRVIWEVALNFVRRCYPEANDINLRPDGDGRLIADFRVNRQYKNGNYEYRESRYEAQS